MSGPASKKYLYDERTKYYREFLAGYMRQGYTRDQAKAKLYEEKQLCGSDFDAVVAAQEQRYSSGRGGGS